MVYERAELAEEDMSENPLPDVVETCHFVTEPVHPLKDSFAEVFSQIVASLDTMVPALIVAYVMVTGAVYVTQEPLDITTL
jgi:hypothetical protein